MNVGDTVYKVMYDRGSWRLLVGLMVRLSGETTGVVFFTPERNVFGEQWRVSSSIKEWFATPAEAVAPHEKAMLARHDHELADLLAVAPKEAAK